MKQGNQFGFWLGQEMKKRRLSDRGLSTLFTEPVSHGAVGRWRRGAGIPSHRNIHELARIFEQAPRTLYEKLGLIQVETADLSPDAQWLCEQIMSLSETELVTLRAVVSALVGQRPQSPAPTASDPDSVAGSPPTALAEP